MMMMVTITSYRYLKWFQSLSLCPFAVVWAIPRSGSLPNCLVWNVQHVNVRMTSGCRLSPRHRARNLQFHHRGGLLKSRNSKINQLQQTLSMADYDMYVYIYICHICDIEYALAQERYFKRSWVFIMVAAWETSWTRSPTTWVDYANSLGQAFNTFKNIDDEVPRLPDYAQQSSNWAAISNRNGEPKCLVSFARRERKC